MLTFRIPRPQFLTVIADGTVCASSDAYDSGLTSARLTVTPDGILEVVSTDRYVMGRARTRLNLTREDETTGEAVPDMWGDDRTPPAEAVSFSVPVAVLAKLRTLHPSDRAGVRRWAPENALTVTASDDLLIVRSSTYELGEITTRTPLRVADRLPDAVPGRLFEQWGPAAPEDAREFGMNPAYLAKFGRVSDPGGSGMLVEPGGPKRASRVRIGDHFVGLIMPLSRLHTPREL